MRSLCGCRHSAFRSLSIPTGHRSKRALRNCRQGYGAVLFGGEVDGDGQDETQAVSEPVLAAADLGAWAGLPLSGVYVCLPQASNSCKSAVLLLGHSRWGRVALYVNVWPCLSPSRFKHYKNRKKKPLADLNFI